ncbi:MAG: 2-C-methyl-D-erythritol 4-phosphate cytidylyltransferase [Clostridium sp.]|nr:2-C-methyl-D-erythritol 4-phosphate cytidylyltransferase [Clostridium sp.]MDU7085969.1 2-C-methyl-D-erythritol 4-phosphate cytidylyltransferase [Clostridium sp.]
MGKNIALILAAGQGKRMGAGINKQFLTLQDKPVLYHTLKAFSDNSQIDEIVLVCAEKDMDYCKNSIVKEYGFSKVKSLVSGGAERQDSVYNGLKAIKSCDIVLIHDGARPFITNEIIDEGIKMAHIHGACTCGVKAKDTIKLKDSEGFSKETLNREVTFLVQTPQCFKYELILDCHEKLNKNRKMVTDDTMVVEMFNHKVYLYEGSYFNIKITTPDDMIIGENILKNSSNE